MGTAAEDYGSARMRAASEYCTCRTSSRIGRQDKLVNAKRVNYFAAALADAGGWKTAPVTAATHPVYFEENTTSQTRGDDLKRLRGSVDGEGNSF